MSAMASATSGMRSTAAWTRTMAVITPVRLSGDAADGSRRLVHGAQVALAVEPAAPRRVARAVSSVRPQPDTSGAERRARPRALERHQPGSGPLEPPEDALGLPGGRGRRGAEAGLDRLARAQQRREDLPRVGAPRRHGGADEPPVPDHDHLPAPVTGRPGRREHRAPGQRDETLEP